MPVLSVEEHIASIYESLFRAWGRQHWWPARSRFEVIVGAYLTQNTNWTNVELALRQLRAARMLNVGGIRNISRRKLERLIRSSGYFRQKAQRLKTFVGFLDQDYGGSLTRMFARPTAELREQRLALYGVGAETADSILLYAGQHPVFVVDAYTRRIAERHGLALPTVPYDDLRILFERGLSPEPAAVFAARSSGATAHLPSRMSLAARSSLTQSFNEMHALMVGVGKKHCLKSKPQCEACPLKPLLLPAPDL